jgi:(p)ppGpp synthase/HD superfamily hydrolase
MKRRVPDGRSRVHRSKRALLGKRFLKAFMFAANMHAGQTRKQTAIPYIAHLMSVSALVLEAGGDEDLAIAALLHDVVEDCGGQPVLRQVRRCFGERVAHVVAGCTDSDAYPKPPWRERKESYLRHLRIADADVRLVSAADKLHNLREILRDYHAVGEPVWQRFAGKRDGTLWYYRAWVREFRRRSLNPLVKELERIVAELDRTIETAEARRTVARICLQRNQKHAAHD